MYLKMLSIAVDFHPFDVTLNIMRSLNHHDEKLRINLKNGRNNLAAITASHHCQHQRERAVWKKGCGGKIVVVLHLPLLGFSVFCGPAGYRGGSGQSNLLKKGLLSRLDNDRRKVNAAT